MFWARVRQCNILTVSFMENIMAKELWIIADDLNAHYEGWLHAGMRHHQSLIILNIIK